MSMSELLLSMSGVNAHYGRAHVLFDIALELRRGEVMAILGRNGAGKSTSMKTVMGLVRASSGKIEFHGTAIEQQPTYKISRLGIGYVPEDRRIFSDLTVTENLEVGARPPREGAPHWTVSRVFELFPNLGQMRKRAGNRMSGGEQQMLAIARTLMGNPILLLLDEPSEGLSPLIVEQMAHTIVDLKAEGLTILVSEQNLHFASHIADQVTIIEKGRVRYFGAMAELQHNIEVQREYLTV
jgi:branched-chain amino acid transport system ATP-binding protein